MGWRFCSLKNSPTLQREEFDCGDEEINHYENYQFSESKNSGDRQIYQGNKALLNQGMKINRGVCHTPLQIIYSYRKSATPAINNCINQDDDLFLSKSIRRLITRTTSYNSFCCGLTIVNFFDIAYRPNCRSSLTNI